MTSHNESYRTTHPYLHNSFGMQTQGMELASYDGPDGRGCANGAGSPVDRLRELEPILHLLPAGTFEVVRRLREGGQITMDDMLGVLRTCHRSLGDMIVALEAVKKAHEEKT